MRVRAAVLTALTIAAFATPARAQLAFNDATLDQFLKGLTAEKTELDKVGTQLKDLDDKIAKFRECYKTFMEVSGGKGGLAAKIALKAKCGATSDDGFQKERSKLLDAPEKLGASTAGLKLGDYAQMKERVTGYLNGDRSFAAAELKALGARSSQFSSLLGVELAKASGNAGGGLGGRIGNALGANMRMFTPDMTWAYVGYLWGLMYMSGATMFETAYQPGQWTQWTISDESQPDNKLVLERALLSREADGSEWWRIKTVNTSGESADTIILESQFKKMDESGTMMQVVRMRGKLPGDTEGKELMVPQNLSMLSTAGAFPFKPTAESVAGATVGTETIKVGSGAYVAKHVKFGTAGGSMEWWIADKAPGGVVRVQFSGNGEKKWTMDMTAAGSGAKSELGVK